MPNNKNNKPAAKNPNAPKFWNITKIRNEDGTGTAGRIDIYGVIDDFEFCGDETTPKNFISALNELGDVDYLDIHMFTPGGSVYAGTAIHSLICQYPKTVNCYVEGIVASIGTVIMCAADHVYISDIADTFYHNPIAFIFWETMNAQEMKDYAAELERAAEPIILAYSKKTGKTRDELIALMNGANGKGTWLNAQECIDYGFADDYIPDGKKPLDIAACISPGVYNYRGHQMDFTKYNHAAQRAAANKPSNGGNKGMGFNLFGKPKPKAGTPLKPRNEVVLDEVVCFSCGGVNLLNPLTGEVTAGAPGDGGGGDSGSGSNGGTQARLKTQAYMKPGKSKARAEAYIFDCVFCGATNSYNTEIQSDGDEGEPVVGTGENGTQDDPNADVQAAAVETTCPQCGAAVTYDTATATQNDDGSYQVSCPECGAEFADTPNVGESSGGDTGANANAIQAAYRRGIRDERKRASELADIAASAPGMATAVHAAIKNGNNPDAVRKRVINAGGATAKQNPQGVLYLANARRDTAAVNNIGRPTPVGAYNAQKTDEERYQTMVAAEMDKLQGRSAQNTMDTAAVLEQAAALIRGRRPN